MTEQIIHTQSPKSNTNVLVAGGAGYIGSHTCKLLSAAGYTPITIDDLSTGHIESVKWGDLVIANINDTIAVSETIKKYDIKSVIHFAGFSLVGESVANPDKYFHNNTNNAEIFLKTCIGAGVKNFVFSSTAAVYGNPTTDIITESHDRNPINPYGESKVLFENALDQYSTSCNFKYVVLRYFNAAGSDPDCEIGESHSPETHLIPLVCKAVKDDQRVKVFGSDYDTTDGSAVRDYVHVNDLARAHIKALEALDEGLPNSVFNLGRGTGTSVMDIVNASTKVFGKCNFVVEDRRAGDPATLVADITAAKEVLDWKPEISLEDMLTTAMNWEMNRTY